MEKKSLDQISIQAHLFSLLIPQEILVSFEIVSVIEKEEDLLIDLIEKELCIPKSEYELIQNGFMNPVELNSFPVAGKRCFLRLKRRRWKKHNSEDSISFTNVYDFTLNGTKATKSFGSFLKEFGL